MNKAILIGNLGSDPDIRSMQNGGRVANLNLATTEGWKDKNTGERKTKTEWHRVVVFNEGLVKVCENYLRKGSKVAIEGQIETRKWTDSSGQDKYSTEIVLKPFGGSLEMLDSKPEQSSHNEKKQNGYQTQDDFSDDVPFMRLRWKEVM